MKPNMKKITEKYDTLQIMIIALMLFIIILTPLVPTSLLSSNAIKYNYQFFVVLKSPVVYGFFVLFICIVTLSVFYLWKTRNFQSNVSTNIFHQRLFCILVFISIMLASLKYYFFNQFDRGASSILLLSLFPLLLLETNTRLKILIFGLNFFLFINFAFAILQFVNYKFHFLPDSLLPWKLMNIQGQSRARGVYCSPHGLGNLALLSIVIFFSLRNSLKGYIWVGGIFLGMSLLLLSLMTGGILVLGISVTIKTGVEVYRTRKVSVSTLVFLFLIVFILLYFIMYFQPIFSSLSIKYKPLAYFSFFITAFRHLPTLLLWGEPESFFFEYMQVATSFSTVSVTSYESWLLRNLCIYGAYIIVAYFLLFREAYRKCCSSLSEITVSPHDFLFGVVVILLSSSITNCGVGGVTLLYLILYLSLFFDGYQHFCERYSLFNRPHIGPS